MTTHERILQAIQQSNLNNPMRVGELATNLGMPIEDINSVLHDMAKNKQIWHEKRLLDGMERWVVIPRTSAKMQKSAHAMPSDYEIPVLISNHDSSEPQQAQYKGPVYTCLKTLERNPQGLSERQVLERCGVPYARTLLRTHIGTGRVIQDTSIRPHLLKLADGITAESAVKASKEEMGKQSRFGRSRQPIIRHTKQKKSPVQEDEPTPQTASVLGVMQKQIGGDHYKKLDIQPWDAMQAWQTHEQFKGFLHGNAIKYIARYESKGGIEDLRKAIHYLEKLVSTIETAA